LFGIPHVISPCETKFICRTAYVPEQMSALEDLVEALLHVRVMGATFQIGKEAEKSFVEASERNNWLGMLFSAIVCGGSMYAFQSSARNVNRILRKHRATIPVYDLRKDKSRVMPVWYLPK